MEGGEREKGEETCSNASPLVKLPSVFEPGAKYMVTLPLTRYTAAKDPVALFSM